MTDKANKDNKKGIQPYEPLRENVDAALTQVHETMLTLQNGINGGVGPMISSLDTLEVNKAIAVLEACVNAFTSEYKHMATLNEEMRAQRDELKRKLESLRRLFNRSFNDDDGGSGGDDHDDKDASSPQKRGK